MGAFFRKDLFIFWRDRKEVLISLLLPIILIVVLNVAFSGLFNDEGNAIEIHLGLVEEDDSSVGFYQLQEAVEKMDISKVEKEAILQQASMIEPGQMVFNFFHNTDLKEWIHVENFSESEAVELVENGELDAFVKIPEGFTYEVLSSVLFQESADVALTIHADSQSIELSALQNMVDNFVDSINLQFAMGAMGGPDSQEALLPEGGIETLEGAETFSFSQYITIAMSTLFALFMAQTVAMKTITEKRERVFNRIILSDRHPLNFLIGKTLATFFLSLAQMIIILVLSQWLFNVFPDQSLEFWFGLISVLTAYILTVAGISAIFTSLTLVMNDTNAVDGIFTIIIMGMGIIGGGFVPIQFLPKWLQSIGEWTPNGITLTSLLEWIQFGDSQELIFPIIYLLVFFVMCIGISIVIFPRRGRY